jgi:hypothetical protein
MPLNTALARRPLHRGYSLASHAQPDGPRGLTRVGGFDWRERLRLRDKNRPLMSGPEKLKRGVQVVGRSLVVGGSSYVFGYLQGRHGTKTMTPMPVDLLAAIVLHTVGLAVVDRAHKLAPHLHAIGDGALAAHLAASGRGRGKAVRAKKGQVPVLEGALELEGSMTPALPAGTASLTDEELARIARVAA